MKKNIDMLEDIEERPIVLFKETIDILLKGKEPAGLLALYCFYYYTGVWQRTNQPHATIHYVAKCLKISEERCRRYKSVLMKLGFIKEVIKRDVSHKITGQYIQVRYYLGQKPPSGFSTVWKSIRKNAYSNNNKIVTTLRDGDEEKGLRPKLLENIANSNPIDNKLFLQFEKVLRTHRKIFRKVYPKKWIKEFQELRRSDGIDKEEIEKVIKWYGKHIGEKYIPQAYSAKSFRDKFLQLEAAMKRNGGDVIVSKKAKMLAKELMDEDFIRCNEPLSSVAKAIQQTIINYKKYRKAHKQIKWNYTGGGHPTPIESFINHFEGELPSTTKEVIQCWFKYSRALPIFSLDLEAFNKWGRQQSKNFSQSNTYWYMYIKGIKQLYENTKED